MLAVRDGELVGLLNHGEQPVGVRESERSREAVSLQELQNGWQTSWQSLALPPHVPCGASAADFREVSHQGPRYRAAARKVRRRQIFEEGHSAASNTSTTGGISGSTREKRSLQSSEGLGNKGKELRDSQVELHEPK